VDKLLLYYFMNVLYRELTEAKFFVLVDLSLHTVLGS
jgi:hypothetical protein